MAAVKALGKLVAILAAFYICFRYIGHFSERQSSVLTVLGWMGYGLYNHFSALQALQHSDKAFYPFAVSILPKWDSLLPDFRLIRSKEDLRRLYEAMSKVPPEQHSLFRSGMNFTVVAPPSYEDGLPGLAYLDDHRRFVSDLDFSESITETKYDTFIRGEHPFFGHPAYGWLPEVYVRWYAGGGCEIGLEVQLDWWKRLCETGGIGALAKIRSDPDYSCGSTRLAIAMLPQSELAAYYQKDDYEREKEQKKTRDEKLRANGWQRKVEKDSEISDPWSYVEHRYFTVSHRVI